MENAFPLPPPFAGTEVEYEPLGSVLEVGGIGEVVITSFGYLHPGGVPHGQHLVLDLRKLLYNPYKDLAMRELTGLEPQVRAHVLGTPGAQELIDGLVAVVQSIRAQLNARGLVAQVAFGCSGGRHRSPAVANEVGHALHQGGRGHQVEIVHRDILRPVVHP
jgi:RNase adaptor protein for sRNA GlmZ degradation